MAGQFFTVAMDVERASGTAKVCLLELDAPATIQAKVEGIWVMFQGVSATAAPVLIEIGRSSTAGSGGTAVTPVKTSQGGPAIQCTAQAYDLTWAVAPVQTFIMHRYYIHPQGGIREYLPLNRPIIVDGSADAQSRCNIHVTAAATVDVICGMDCEE